MCRSGEIAIETPLLDFIDRLVDVHNHVGDRNQDNVEFNAAVKSSNIKQLCIMSSTLSSQARTYELASRFKTKVKAFYGVHPWFTHQISLLPQAQLPSKLDHYITLFPTSPLAELIELLPSLAEVISIEIVLEEMRERMKEDEWSGLGEIGLDRAFKLLNVPYSANSTSCSPSSASSPSPPSSLVTKKYSNLTTPLFHQIAIVRAQINLALDDEEGRRRMIYRPISFHSVQSTAATVELLSNLKKERGKVEWRKVRLCIHSFLGSAETIQQLQKLHPGLFFSVSSLISTSSSPAKFISILTAIEPHRLLLETDHSNLASVDRLMSDIFQRVKAVGVYREMSELEVIELLEWNQRRFLEG